MRAMLKKLVRPLSAGRSVAGLTLIELMVVVLIGAILMGLAVPAMRAMVASNQLMALTDGFASTLSLGRSEAVKLNSNVAINPVPASAGQVWTGGWRLFVDSNLNNVWETTETTLRLGQALPTGFTVNSTSSFNGVLAFDGTGRPVQGAGEFVVCQGGGPWVAGGTAQMIIVSAAGSVRVAPNDSTGHPIDTSGNPITGCAP